ncbi:MAG: prephenate dehydrogenase [Agathobacter sp.]|nr:prephenate dehydrogenase [Agathobacter sp.]
MKFNEIGFIGLGLIGGSIARKIKALNPDAKIFATAGHEETIKEAYSMGLIENNSKLALDKFSNCDIIFLCAPVQKNIEYLNELKDIIKSDCVITDVGSTKTEIHNEVIRLGLEKNFIGGHPMTGSEKTGITNSDEYLLENAYYIITPTQYTKETEVEAFRNFVISLGSIPLILDYEAHDYATAAISHLPHMISFSLVNLVKKVDDNKETMKTIAAGGFRDMSRIAASSPVMWQNICFSNKEQLLKLMDMYIDTFSELKKYIQDSDKEKLLSFFQEAKDYRDSLTIPAKKHKDDYYEIFIDLKDETGGIAIIANILAFKGISIKNIGIINNREFEEGVLRIELYDLDSLNTAVTVLEERNYIVYRR